MPIGGDIHRPRIDARDLDKKDRRPLRWQKNGMLSLLAGGERLRVETPPADSTAGENLSGHEWVLTNTARGNVGALKCVSLTDSLRRMKGAGVEN
jgi:hypothetical protein